MLFVTQTDRGTFYAHDTNINPTLKIRCVFDYINQLANLFPRDTLGDMIYGHNSYSHRGSQLYFHITRYVLKRRREDTFWGAKSESRVSAPFFASKTVRINRN
jgi:hypothetical protein